MAALAASTQYCGTQPAAVGRQLDVLADGAEDLADRRAQEEQGEDRHDRDEGEDQRVLRETLAFLVTPESAEERGDEGHDRLPPVCPPTNQSGESVGTIAAVLGAAP